MSNVSRYVFGKSKLGRMKRTIECDATTFNNVQWIPNFKGSQRGAVLKSTTDQLSSYGINKRSQIDSINSIDISNLPYKKIVKLLNENSSSSAPYSVSFMIPEQTVETCEIFFRGKFCNEYIEFWCDDNNNNLIVHSINFESKEALKLVEKSKIAIGYRVIKVKGIKVVNKRYADILKMITAASNDLRVDYGVVFEQGHSDWYNMKKPSSPSTHLRHSQSVANVQDSKASSRRRSANMSKRRKSQNLLTKSKHVKKTKSAEINKKSLQKMVKDDGNDSDDLLISGVPMRRNKKSASRRSKSKQFEVGKVSFGTSKLGITQKEMECDSETFMDCDFVPNFKGSQRGAVLKKSNNLLLRQGLIKKTQIESINDNPVGAMSYHTIIEGLNQLISAEETFSVVFNIPEREVNTVEMFVRGPILEHIEFIADEHGNNCIIRKIKAAHRQVLKNKCKLSSGYRIKQIKTSKMINKKHSDIVRYLKESCKDLRVQYLIIFEEGRLEWYGDYNLSEERQPTEKKEKEEEKEKVEDELPLAAPIQNHTVTHLF